MKDKVLNECDKCGREDSLNFYDKISEDIEGIGWSIVSIFSTKDEPEYFWAYTIGIKESLNHPELLIAGCETDLSAPILNSIGDYIKEMKVPLKHGQILDGLLKNDYKLKVIKMDVDAYRDKVTQYFEYFQEDDIEYFQVLWPDVNGKFYGEEDYNYEDHIEQEYFGFRA
ncbi:DUF4262 domain-containing protein [Spirochaetota bacterium]